MAEIFLVMFACSSLILVIWGLLQRERVYQYPFLAGAAWVGRILPMAIGLVRNPDRLPSAVIKDHGLEMALLMSALCALMGLLGYWYRGPSLQTEERSAGNLSPDRLFQAGCVLLFQSAWGFTGLARLSGGYVAYFSTSGNYALSWRGLPVRYAFLMQLVNPGLLCCLMGTLRKPSLSRWIVIGAAALLPVALIAILGRRAQAATLGIVVLFAWYFCRGRIIPRWLVALGLPLAVVGSIVAPEYRTHSQIGADRSRLAEIDVGRSVNRVLTAEEYSAFDEAAVVVAASHRTQKFGFGLTNYNRFIAVTVPRQLVGEDFKRSLMLQDVGPATVVLSEYGWRPAYGTVIPGPADAFYQFWFFGAFLYFLIGYAYRWLWELTRHGDVRAQLAYVVLAPCALMTVHGSVGYLPPAVFWTFVVLGPVMLYAGRGDTQARPAADTNPGDEAPHSQGFLGAGIQKA